MYFHNVQIFSHRLLILTCAGLIRLAPAHVRRVKDVIQMKVCDMTMTTTKRILVDLKLRFGFQKIYI